MKSRRRCLLVALWLTLPILMSVELETAFTSDVVLSRYGLLTAALNLPGFLLVYFFAYQTDLPTVSLIAAGDAVVWVPLFYGALRWGEWVRVRRRRWAERRRVAREKV